ncbi:MAG: DUF2891 domain-containing protein [Gammaproteobacteria bacterium]
MDYSRINRAILVIGLALLGSACSEDAPVTTVSTPTADTLNLTLPPPRANVVEDRFAQLAFDCVHREYPNKISHVLSSAEDVKTPSELTPMFYGCFDWHSAVHGHWLLVRLLKQSNSDLQRQGLRKKLSLSFTPDNAKIELEYYNQPGRGSFERPYGVAWFLQLVAELHESDDPQLVEWRETLAPLEQAIVNRVSQWLPRLAYPIRLGTHNQSAFAFGLMLDYARTVGNETFEALLVDKSRLFHLNDKDCPLEYEPSGEDFLSPCLMEADLMRRVLPQADFSRWLDGFLPDLPRDGSSDWLTPGVVRDATDGKLVHLDGVNLSRAWALLGIAASLDDTDTRKPSLIEAAEIHQETGIAAVSDTHYSGSHWLASFALYLTSQRGIKADTEQ